MAILRPSSDLITGGWTSTDASLSAAIDESTYSDTDYISTSTAGDIARVSLGTYADAPPALILKRDVWTSQPQVPIDPVNGVVVSYDAALREKINILSSYSSFSLSSGAFPVIQVTAEGKVISFAATDNTITTQKNLPSLTAASSKAMFIRFYKPSISIGSIIYLFGTGAGNTGFMSNTSTNFRCGVYLNGSIFDSANDLSINAWHSVMLCHDGGGTTRLYVNGKLDSTITTAAWALPASTLTFNSYASGASYGAAHNILAFAILNRGVSDSEARRLTNGYSHWQIFRKQPKPIFISSPRGTHTLKYRACSPEADRGLIARVLELSPNAHTVASHTKTYTELGTTPAEQTLTLSPGEAASITNGATLALEVEST